MLGKSSIWSKLFQKFEICWKFRKFVKISKFCYLFEGIPGSRSCSTSYLSGYQVDGSPLVAIGKPRPKGTATFCNFGLFGHVSR